MDDGPAGPAPDATVGSVLAFSPDGRTLSSVLGSVKSVRWDVTDRTRTDAGPGSYMLTPMAGRWSALPTEPAPCMSGRSGTVVTSAPVDADDAHRLYALGLFRQDSAL
jgi:hypothetical protein